MLRAFAVVTLLLAPEAALALECPPPGYDGNADCGYECGEGGTCCGNPWYRGSYIFGTWRPDPACMAPKAERPPAGHRRQRPRPTVRPPS